MLFLSIMWPFIKFKNKNKVRMNQTFPGVGVFSDGAALFIQDGAETLQLFPLSLSLSS